MIMNWATFNWWNIFLFHCISFLISVSFIYFLKWVKSFAIFWYMFFCSKYITRPNQLKLPTMISSIMVIGVLTQYALLHSTSGLKDSQMNLQYCPIWEHFLYKLERGHNAVEATKTVCAKGESTVDLSTVTRWLKEFHSGCKNIGDQSKSSQTKIVDLKL